MDQSFHPCLALPFLGANFPPWVLGRCLILIDSEEFYFVFENHTEMGSKLKSSTALPPCLSNHIHTQTNPRYSTALEQNLGLVPESRLVIGFVFPAGFSEVKGPLLTQNGIVLQTSPCEQPMGIYF